MDAGRIHLRPRRKGMLAVRRMKSGFRLARRDENLPVNAREISNSAPAPPARRLRPAVVAVRPGKVAVHPTEAVRPLRNRTMTRIGQRPQAGGDRLHRGTGPGRDWTALPLSARDAVSAQDGRGAIQVGRLPRRRLAVVVRGSRFALEVRELRDCDLESDARCLGAARSLRARAKRHALRRSPTRNRFQRGESRCLKRKLAPRSATVTSNDKIANGEPRTTNHEPRAASRDERAQRRALRGKRVRRGPQRGVLIAGE
jgi:hypothetical protein